MDWQAGQQPIMGGHRIAERVAELERQMAELKKAIAISPTSIVIKSPGSLTIEAANMDLKASLIKLPGGAQPIARMGDTVAGPGGVGTITGPCNPIILG